ncbi:hypothetical protein MKX01_026367 [Papaver californicum]|nr:hypothetical protein MKX01_026367 [Papaver californicum]
MAIFSIDRSIPKFISYAISVVFLISCFSFSSTKAYDALDPNGITIKWDVMNWTPDGYVAVVTMYNFQQYRHIQAPGWTLGWAWSKKEVIWNMVGAQTTEQGDCSKYKGNIPHCCNNCSNCCKGGVLNSWVQDSGNAASSFQVSVGAAGTSNKTVRVPKNFTLKAPGPGYTCGPAKIVKSSKFVTSNLRRTTQALMTWNITCTYSQFLSQKTPTCCLSLSSFYNETIVPCRTCTCGYQNNITQPGSSNLHIHVGAMKEWRVNLKVANSLGDSLLYLLFSQKSGLGACYPYIQDIKISETYFFTLI